ncbi:type II secretion system F family protein [Mycobacterium sp.]|uniref:type II secretion system F family protein n=1 Tax=Mycobacterium sp. TaxID=1785 RepID=UPI003A84E9A7
MNGVSGPIFLLAVALLVSPATPRRRLAAPAPSAPPRFGPREVGWVCGCVLAVAIAVLPLTTSVAAAVVAATAGLRYRRGRRLRGGEAEARTLQDAVGVLVGELRVGAHPVRAFDTAADETADGPVSTALRAVAARARMGADVAAGLRAAARSSVLQAHWERIAVCWQLAGDHGLSIAALMNAAQRDIVERKRFRDRVDSGLAGARATAVILAGLPLLGVLLGQLLGGRPFGFLFGGAAGGWFLVAGLTLVCAGLLWSDRIIDRAASM